MTISEAVDPVHAQARWQPVLAISGSLRSGSWNSLLLGLVAGRLEAHGVGVREHSLRHHPLPLYDPDQEAATGVPTEAARLRQAIAESEGLLIACPEHNGSVTAVLKNALDWSSRPLAGESALAPFTLKPVLIVGTSVSPFGAVRAIGHLRAILAKMGALVMPEDLAVPNASVAFGSGGPAGTGLRDADLRDPGARAAAERAVAAFARQLPSRLIPQTVK